MKKSVLISDRFITCLAIIVIAVMVISAVFASSTTTFEKTASSYYGKTTQQGKFTTTVTPTADDPNSKSSTATSTDPCSIFGELQRITIAADGCDLDFTLTVKDSDAITLFEKTDCNTALLPLSYMVYMDDTEGNPHGNVPVAGFLTVDTNDVDPNNLTSLAVTFYYNEPRY